jgi:hypothetical protein
MRRLTLWLSLAALAAALAVGAAAAVGGQQHTNPVTATLGANRTMMHETTCTGDDGEYRQAQEVYAGSIGGDPRLTGLAALYLGSLTNMTTGNGTTRGLLIVTDPSSHQVKVRAVLQGVATGTGGMNVKGFLTGSVQDQGSSLGGQLAANFLAIRNGTSIYAGIGQPGTNANPAVIQGGHCQPASSDRPGK